MVQIKLGLNVFLFYFFCSQNTCPNLKALHKACKLSANSDCLHVQVLYGCMRLLDLFGCGCSPRGLFNSHPCHMLHGRSNIHDFGGASNFTTRNNILNTFHRYWGSIARDPELTVEPVSLIYCTLDNPSRLCFLWLCGRRIGISIFGITGFK